MDTQQVEQRPGEIFRLIPLIMRDVGAIGKNRKNQQQGYAFRGIDDVYFALQPAFAKHGVFVVPQVTERTVSERTNQKGTVLFYTTLRVRFTFFAPDGSSVSAETVGEAMDSGDKSANKAQSAAMKYAMLEVFCIPTESPDDADYQTHEVAAGGVDGATGEDLLADDARFESELNAAFQSRGFKPSDADKAKTQIAAAYGVGTIDKLDCGQRHTVLAAVRAGKADKYKAQPAMAAAERQV